MSNIAIDPGFSDVLAKFPAVKSSVKQRNTTLDFLFYDVDNLNSEESELLIGETNLEGSIIVVWPEDSGRDIGVQKFDGYEKFRAEPGDLLQYFTIAGVGSSDLGAAALARTVANHYGQPVGAIVAGYGIADLLGESLGGWFGLGAANRLMQVFHASSVPFSDETTATDTTSDVLAGKSTGSADSDTLLRVLSDKERQIKLIAGHSKGCLSIAYALQTLALGKDAATKKKAKSIEIITLGAVVEFPAGFNKVKQYLGSIDFFGGMNSRSGIDYIKWDGAWHHLNTSLPAHMDFSQILNND